MVVSQIRFARMIHAKHNTNYTGAVFKLVSGLAKTGGDKESQVSHFGELRRLIMEAHQASVR